MDSALLTHHLLPLLREAAHFVSMACPLCGKSMAANGDAGLLSGIGWSWLLLASMPILMIGTITTVLIRSYRKLQRATAMRLAEAAAAAPNQSQVTATDTPALVVAAEAAK